MKSYLLVAVLSTLVYYLPVNALQMQPSHQKLEVQGAIKFGETQTRTLAPDAIHAWNLALQAGQYVVVEVLQKGIAVVVRIVDPDGAQRGEFDSSTGAAGTEKACRITSRAGIWQVEVAPLEITSRGGYEIEFTVLREVAETDSLELEALKYYRRRDYNKAEPLLIQALKLKEEALGPDHLDVAKSLCNLGDLYKN